MSHQPAKRDSFVQITLLPAASNDTRTTGVSSHQFVLFNQRQMNRTQLQQCIFKKKTEEEIVMERHISIIMYKSMIQSQQGDVKSEQQNEHLIYRAHSDPQFC